jgi:hypothetical protein
MDVILHIGAHRTATTALQKTLGANGGDLAQLGLVYWGPKTTRTGLLDGLIGRPEALSDDRRKAAAVRVSRRMRKAAHDGAETLFVSDENMLGSMQSALAGKGLYPDAGARVATVAQAFVGSRITLALAIRTLDDWWSSVRAFRAGRDAAVPDAAELAVMALRSGSWRDVVGDLASSMPGARIRVWSHEVMADLPEAVVDRLTGLTPRRTRLDLHRNAMPTGAADVLEPQVRARLRERYADDLAWLRAGADGLAEFIDAGPGRDIPDQTGEERAEPDDGKLQDQGRYRGRLA